MKGLCDMFKKNLYKFLKIEYLEDANNDQWTKWDNNYKKRYPIIYWLEWELPLMYYNIINKINFIPYMLNKYIRKPHIIDTKLKPMYYDKDRLMLHGMFSLLVDFVEIECLNLYKFCMELTDEDKQLIKKGQGSKLGVKYLQYKDPESDDDVEGERELYEEQCKKDNEILKLYFWWKKRMNREDHNEAEVTGLNAYYDYLSKKYNGLFNGMNNYTLEEKKKCQELNKKCNDLEIKHFNKDQEMLHKLIDLRTYLWT